MNALDAAWFSGFADGEGCFSLQRVNRRTPRPVFSIRLRADDAYVLDWCCSEFAVGIVYYNDPKQGSVNVLGKITAQSKPQAMWTVARKVETLRLMQHFDAFPLRSSKKRDYEIWREMVLEYNKSRWVSARNNRGKQVPEDKVYSARKS